MNIPAIITSSGTITLYWQGKAHTVDKSHRNYNLVREAVNKGDTTNLDGLLKPAEAIKNKVASTPNAQNVEVRDGQVFYAGEAVHNSVVDRILQFVAEKFDFAPLVQFLENLIQNPSKASLDNLYRFLEHNKMPITQDGCFLAYKRVTHDYKDGS
jgi:hypothetical protein